MQVILASQSPRRKELMDQFKIPYQVIVSGVDETLEEGLTMEEQSKQVAYRKARKVWDDTKELGDRIIISSDTMVVFNQKPYGKPKNREEAVENFRKFSGKTQQVITSYAILVQQKEKQEEIVGITSSNVTFKTMTQEDIEICLEKENVYDKAGGYNIVSFSGVYIENFEGSITAVMGLPMDKIYTILKKYNILSTKE